MNLAENSATALAKYIRESCAASEAAGHDAIMVNVPKPFRLPITETVQIAERLEGGLRLAAEGRAAGFERAKELAQSECEQARAGAHEDDVTQVRAVCLILRFRVAAITDDGAEPKGGG